MTSKQSSKSKSKKQATKDTRNKPIFVDKAQKYFKCTDRERAAFEAGIKLASVYHQFVGAQISKANVKVLEKAIEESVRIQPFVSEVKVKLTSCAGSGNIIRNKQHEYDYLSLIGNMLDMELEIKYNKSIAIANIKYIKDLNYPLMYISSLE